MTDEAPKAPWLTNWRGVLGWSLTFSITYQLVLYPLAVFAALWFKPDFPVDKLPKLDWVELGRILLGLIGVTL